MKFKLAGKEPIIVVKASVNRKGPYDFAVDTGASSTVLSKQTAQELNVTKNPSTPKKGHGCCGPVDLSMTTVESVRVGNAEAKKLAVAIMDLSTISKCIEIQLAGIIGYNFMKDYRVIIDYPNKQIAFEKEKRPRALCQPPALVGRGLST
jgi:predicted aspartyl protease